LFEGQKGVKEEVGPFTRAGGGKLNAQARVSFPSKQKDRFRGITAIKTAKKKGMGGTLAKK